MNEEKGWLCGRVLRWHEPGTALDDGPPYGLQIFDADLGIWLTLAQAKLEEDAMAQGIPVLRGPYVVDFSDIPHDGDRKTLWTPQVGDVLLRLFPDWQLETNWDHGRLFIGQNVDGTLSTPINVMVQGNADQVGAPSFLILDNIFAPFNGETRDSSGNEYYPTAFMFHSSDPVQVQLAQTAGTDPTQGHVELYALVARAVAP